MLVMRGKELAARVPAAGSESTRPLIRRPPVIGGPESIAGEEAKPDVLDLQPSGER